MKKTLWILLAIVLTFTLVLGTSSIVDAISVKVESEAVANACVVEDSRPSEWEEYLFPDDEVIEVRIYMDEGVFESMSANAIDEEYVPASVIYNGIEIDNIAVRPKGNSSLTFAVKDGTDGYSIRLRFDEYLDQNLYGITAINLNNCYGDESYIREKMAYEIMEQMGLPVPETVFSNVYINDTLFGVYLAVQQVDENLTEEWFEDGSGVLYKPEGTGADLVYIDDDYDTYTGMIEKTNVDKDAEEALVNMIYQLNNGGDLDSVLNVDMALRYLAVNTSIINLDSYVGGMFHNYYLYGEGSKYIILPWDLNETFTPFGSSGQDSFDVTELLIDEPTNGAVENYPLVEALLSNSEYLAAYHEYLEEIINGPMQIDTFTNRALELTALIDEYIEVDPSADYNSFLTALYNTDTNEAVASDENVPPADLPTDSEAVDSEIADDRPTQGAPPANMPTDSEAVDTEIADDRPTQGAPPAEMLATTENNTADVASDAASTTTFNNMRGMNREMGTATKTSPALIDFVKTRTENILAQLNGEIPSTNDGQGNSTGNIPATSGNNTNLDLTANIGEKGARAEGMEMRLPPELLVDGEISEEVIAQMKEAMENGEIPEGTMPEGERPIGDMPEGEFPDNSMARDELPGVEQSGTENSTSWVLQGDNAQYLLILIASILIIGLAILIKHTKK